MGCNFLGKTCWLTPPNSERVLPNPNPARFEVLKTFQVGSALVVKVHYPDCTNYEGLKILVYKNLSEAALKRRQTLDPHFTPSQGPTARFEPTKEGLTLAKLLASQLSAQ